MSDYDKKILGLGGSTTLKKAPQIIKSEDDVDFTLDFVEKEDIFT